MDPTVMSNFYNYKLNYKVSYLYLREKSQLVIKLAKMNDNLINNNNCLIVDYNDIQDNYLFLKTEFNRLDELKKNWQKAFYQSEKIIKDIDRLSNSDTTNALCKCLEYIDTPEETNDIDRFNAGIVNENNQHLYVDDASDYTDSDNDSDNDSSYSIFGDDD